MPAQTKTDVPGRTKWNLCHRLVPYPCTDRTNGGVSVVLGWAQTHPRHSRWAQNSRGTATIPLQLGKKLNLDLQILLHTKINSTWIKVNSFKNRSLKIKLSHVYFRMHSLEGDSLSFKIRIKMVRNFEFHYLKSWHNYVSRPKIWSKKRKWRD